MMSDTSGSPSSSSSGPKPSNSSISTFSSANCSRRLSVTLSSASTSMMIGRNSSESSSLDSVAAASGSTRSSRRGSTCSLILWTLASKPSISAWPSTTLFARSARRLIASPLLPGAEEGPPMALSPGSGGNCSPPGGGGASDGSATFRPSPAFIGLATPKLGRTDGVMPPAPFFLPNALIPRSSGQSLPGPCRHSMQSTVHDAACSNVVNSLRTLKFSKGPRGYLLKYAKGRRPATQGGSDSSCSAAAGPTA